jgi:hypothetical protein
MANNMESSILPPNHGDQHVSEKTFVPFTIGNTMCFIGSSNCGKSYTIAKFLNNRKWLFHHEVGHIYYFYSIWQDIYEELENNLKENVTFIEGFPQRHELESYEKRSILVFDDVLGEQMDNPDLLHLVTVLTHHRSYFSMLVLHNLFPKGKFSKTVSLNCHYFCLFNAKRDQSQISVFGKQAFVHHYNYFMSAYVQSTTPIFGYLIVDLSPSIDKKFALRTSIFRDDDLILFLPD